MDIPFVAAPPPSRRGAFPVASLALFIRKITLEESPREVAARVKPFLRGEV